MAGYNGYSKSNNAVEAEAAGRYPLTKAAKIVAQETGVTIKEARWVLKELGTGGEWHHNSKFYNAVDYYDTAAAVKTIELARTLNMACDESFIATVKASDLQHEDDPLKKLQNPGKYDYNVERFRQAVKTGEWL